MAISVGRVMRKVGDAANPLLAPMRRKRLKRLDFTVISNNCWAGSVYRRYGIPYRSPTVGLYFFPRDYVQFCSRIRHYVDAPLKFISAESSCHADALARKGELSVPVARLDNIEVIFLHYADQEEAEEKWTRRCNRIVWDNMFFKNSEMNGCTVDDLRDFDALPYEKKILFTAQDDPSLSCSIRFPGKCGDEGIVNDTDRYACCMNVDAWLNGESFR